MKARIQQEPRCVLLWQVAPGSAEHAAVEHAARLSRLKVRLFDRRRPGHHHGSPLHRAAHWR